MSLEILDIMFLIKIAYIRARMRIKPLNAGRAREVW